MALVETPAVVQVNGEQEGILYHLISSILSRVSPPHYMSHY